VFEDFLAWQSQRHQRAAGELPAPSGLRSKGQRLVGMGKLMGCETERQLATLISRRSDVEALLDKMFAKLAVGTVRADLVGLRQVGDYAAVSGHDHLCTWPELKAQGWVRGKQSKPAYDFFCGYDRCTAEQLRQAKYYEAELHPLVTP